MSGVPAYKSTRIILGISVQSTVDVQGDSPSVEKVLNMEPEKLAQTVAQESATENTIAFLEKETVERGVKIFS